MAHDLDDIDKGILKLLRKDSNISCKEIGSILHRSASVIYQRTKDLENLGYITGYKAIVDYQKFDNLFITYTFIQLKDHSNETLNEFEQETAEFDEIIECTHITGNFDFIVKIAVPNMKCYNEFMRFRMSKIPSIGTIQTCSVISEKKRVTDYPIA